MYAYIVTSLKNKEGLQMNENMDVWLKSGQKHNLLRRFNTGTFDNKFCFKNPVINPPWKGKRGDWNVDQPNGMISPEGDYYSTSFFDHDLAAREIFNLKNRDEFLERGWLLISFECDSRHTVIEYGNKCTVIRRVGLYTYFSNEFIYKDLTIDDLPQVLQNRLFELLDWKGNHSSFFKPE